MNTANKLIHDQKQASVCQHAIPFWVAVVLLAGLVLYGFGCTKDAPPVDQEPDPIAVRVALVTQQDLAQKIGYVGTVHSRREVKVLAQTAGAVLSLVSEGEAVSEGKTLARIAANEIAARASRMDAEVGRAQTEREFLCETYETDKKLAAEGAITTRQADASKRACDVANAAVTAARAGSREVGATRGKTSEQAPFDGLVLQWLVEPGQNVMPGTPLMLLGSPDLEVRVQVAEQDLDRGVSQGIPAMVRSGKETLQLAVSTVAPMAVSPGRTSEVKIPLPTDRSASWAHGTSARVDFLSSVTPAAIAIPDKALWTANGEDVVFIIDGGRARSVAVTPGIRDRGLVGVVGEIPVGAWVAVSNLDLLKEGASVFAVRPAQSNEVQP